MQELPADLRLIRRTPEFDAHGVPDGLRTGHATATGVWGRIVVSEGALLYRILTLVAEEQVLMPGCVGIVEPGVPHAVVPMGAVRFFVEFLRAPEAGDGAAPRSATP